MATLQTDLLRLPANPEFQLDLFDGLSYRVKFERKNHGHPFDEIEVYWGNSGDPGWVHRSNYHDVIMTVNRATEKAVIYAMTSDGTFMVMPTADKSKYIVYEEAPIDWSNAPCSEETEMSIEAVAAERIAPESGIEKTIMTSGCNEQDENGIYVIDMFFSYSHEAELTIGDVLAHAISQAETVNQGFANSEITNARLRVIDLGIEDNFAGIYSPALNPNLVLYEDQMEAVGADMIADYQTPNPEVPNAGGWAFVPGRTSINSATGPTVFRHEFGHNTGSNHCTPGVLPYASGFDNGNVNTHMCGNNINFYSNPRINDANGTPIGDAVSADNARSITERAGILAGYRTHLVPYDAADVGSCAAVLPDGAYYIQNVASNNYLSPSNVANAGELLVQSTTNTANEDIWELHSLGNGSYQIYNRNRNTVVDVFGNSSATGPNVGVWSNNLGSSNQIWDISEATSGDYIITSKSSGLSLSIPDGMTANGDAVWQATYDQTTNAEWRFIPTTVSPSVVSLSVSSTNVSCTNSVDGTAVVNITGGDGNETYNWSDGATSASRTNLGPGNYRVTVSSQGRGYFHYATVRAAPALFAEVETTRATIGVGGSITITNVLNATGALNYAWSDGGPNSPSRTNVPAGDYVVTITDASGCEEVRKMRIVQTIGLDDYVIQHVSSGLYIYKSGGEVLLGDCPTDDELYRWSSTDEGANVVKFRNTNGGGILTVYGRNASGSMYFTGGDGNVSPHKHTLTLVGEDTWIMQNGLEGFYAGVNSPTLGGAMIHEDVDASEADLWRFIPIVTCSPTTNSSCDDSLNTTDNDAVNLICGCCGVPNDCFIDRLTEGDNDADGDCNETDCSPDDPTVFRRSVCDDGNPNSVGDAIADDCSCQGRPMACLSTPPSELENIAVYGSATVSDNLNNNNNGGAAALIDGNTDGNFSNGSTWHSSGAFGSYADLDLGQQQLAQQILIYPRTDCCTDRLGSVYILLSDTPFSSGNLGTSRAEADYEFQVPASHDSDQPYLVSPQIMGRYLRVQRSTSGSLNLAEIEVLTCPQSAAVLPVRLLSFNGEVRASTNQLTWTTSAEEENAGFVVERSSDDSRFVELGWVEGSGNSSTESSYTFTDEQPLNGRNFYRLRQVDFDGSVNFSRIIQLERTSPTSWSLYPNPVLSSQELTVQFQGESASFALFDLTGRRWLSVRDTWSAGRFSVSLQNIPTGVYILRNEQDGSGRKVVVW